jgi:hypothetical protein
LCSWCCFVGVVVANVGVLGVIVTAVVATAVVTTSVSSVGIVLGVVVITDVIGVANVFDNLLLFLLFK